MSEAKASLAFESVTQRWATLAPRERMLVGWAVVLMVVAMIWWIGIAPALVKIKQTREMGPKLEEQLQVMRSQAQEASMLKGQRALSYEEALRALEAAVKTLGAGATLVVNDERANVMLRAIQADALSQWLPLVRANARLVPTELRLQQSAASAVGQSASRSVAWDGTVVLRLPAR